MNLDVLVIDQPAFQAALNDVRNDESETKFLICGHRDGKPNEIELRTTGGDTSTIADNVADEEFLYIYGRYHSTVDMSTCVKFVYIQWIGDKVPYAKRGRFGVVSGHITEHFAAHHLSFEASSRDDLSAEKIVAQLNESAGVADKVIENSDAASRQQRGFTQTQLPKKDNRPSFQVANVAAQGSNIEIAPDVFEGVAKVRSDTEPDSWIVAGYTDGNPKKALVALATGTGDVSELKEFLTDSEVVYGLLRVEYTNKDEIVSSKFVYIAWVGSSVKPMLKAKVSTHKGAVNEIFSPAHVTIFASDRDEVSMREVMAKIVSKSS